MWRVSDDDFLTEIIVERTARNPEFPGLVEAAIRRRELLREFGARREELGLTQTAVAAVMGTSQSAVARLESGDVDAKLSTVERYAAALGQRVEWRIAKAICPTLQARPHQTRSLGISEVSTLAHSSPLEPGACVRFGFGQPSRRRSTVA